MEFRALRDGSALSGSARVRGRRPGRPGWFPGRGGAVPAPALRPSRAAGFPALSAPTSQGSSGSSPREACTARRREEPLRPLHCGPGGAGRGSRSLGARAPCRLRLSRPRFPTRLRGPLGGSEAWAGGNDLLTLDTDVEVTGSRWFRTVWPVWAVPWGAAAWGIARLGERGERREACVLPVGWKGSEMGQQAHQAARTRALRGRLLARRSASPTWKADGPRWEFRLSWWPNSQHDLPSHPCSNFWNSPRVPQSLFHAKTDIRG